MNTHPKVVISFQYCYIFKGLSDCQYKMKSIYLFYFNLSIDKALSRALEKLKSKNPNTIFLFLYGAHSLVNFVVVNLCFKKAGSLCDTIPLAMNEYAADL